MEERVLPADKRAGVCLHLTSLPGDYGIGELGRTARDFIDRLSSMNLAVWQFLPTGPTGFGDSPYQPLSVFAGNELLIDVEALVRLGLLKRNDVSALRGLPQGGVDFARLIPSKNAVLEYAAQRFDTLRKPGLRADFEQFLQDNDEEWLRDYALYRALKRRHGDKPWPQWDEASARRDEKALAGIENRDGRRIAGVKFLQFLFHRQWQNLHDYASESGIRLFGDMPIYIALDSADAWADPELLQVDDSGRPECVAGVPPDYFSHDGQLWGNPLYDWQRHAQDGYSWWIKRLRHAASLADLVRIDHFRGFEAFWSVPADAPTAREGDWVQGPGDAIFEAMRNALGRLPIVAEDLGVITPEVVALRERYRLPGMKVLQFELAGDDFDPAAIGENCICYTGTHDNDTAIGWFLGGPGDTRAAEEIGLTQSRVLERTGGRPETVHHDLIRLAFQTSAKLAIAPLQDYLGLGSEARLNTPGTTYGNWQWRMLPGQLTPYVCELIGEMTASSGRAGAD